MSIVIKTAHAGQPFRLFQDEYFGLFDTRTGQHPCQREGALLFFKLLERAGIVAADRGILGVGFRSGHHR